MLVENKALTMQVQRHIRTMEEAYERRTNFKMARDMYFSKDTEFRKVLRLIVGEGKKFFILGNHSSEPFQLKVIFSILYDNGSNGKFFIVHRTIQDEIVNMRTIRIL